MRTAADGEASDRTVVEHRDPLVGAIFDQRFRIEYQLAAGGFGAIYRATDLRSDARVALKVLLPKVARDPMVVARFRREAKTLASLRDPHTVTAYELGEARDGTLYIVMELLEGESLYTRFRGQGPLPWRRVLHIAAGVCSSLAEAHALGIVHRDLKPANIHLEPRDGDSDFVKVLDFGIAKIVQGNIGEHTQLTQAGQMIGTIDYMSPEQMVGGELTPASDIYTLGVVIYEMISGRTPYPDAQTATAILAAVLTRTPDPLSIHARVPAALDGILARCLEREPEDRYADVAELAEALTTVALESAARARPALPPTGFEPIATTEATRIDVRFNDSSEPVLDARGPRRRLPEQMAPRAAPPPAPAARPAASAPLPPAPAHMPVVAGVVDSRGTPGPVSPREPTPPSGAVTAALHAKGSQHLIDPRTAPLRPGRGWPDASQPPPMIAAMATPPAQVPPVPASAPASAPPVTMPIAPMPVAPMAAPPMPAPPMAPPPMPPPPMPPPPMSLAEMLAAPAASPAPVAAASPPVAQTPRPSPRTPAPVMRGKRQTFPIEPTIVEPTYTGQSYDMLAVTSYDQLVRRIIWIAVLIAIAAAVVIATH
jgi:serine/threonine protein kinase